MSNKAVLSVLEDLLKEVTVLREKADTLDVIWSAMKYTKDRKLPASSYARLESIYYEYNDTGSS